MSASPPAPPSAVARMIEDLMLREGGFVDDPHDLGHATMYGITEAVARAFGYAGPMEMMPKQMARQIYLERYWTAPRFDRVAMLAPGVAQELFDTGVNQGTGTATRYLQRALNVLNRAYPALAVDGSAGALTLAALRAFLAKRGPVGAGVLRDMLNAQQAVRYIEIAEADPAMLDFEYGWQRTRAGA